MNNFKKIFFKLLKIILKKTLLKKIKIYIPYNKNYIIYIKIAKTGGSTIVDYFENNTGVVFLNDFKNLSQNQQIDTKKLIVIVNDQVDYFIQNYDNIWKQSFIFSSVRNPLTRFESGFNFHSFCQNKIPSDIFFILKKYKNFYSYDWKKKYDRDTIIKISAYNHLLFKQYESLIRNNKKIYNYLIRIESFEDDFLHLLDLLKLKNRFIFLYKKNENINHNKYILSSEEKELIKKEFKQDFEFFRY